MSDSSVKLKIQSQLDNAGLKATQDQLNGLEQQLGRTNAAGSKMAQGLTRELGKLPNGLGNITKQVSGLAGVFGATGPLGLAIAAITTGFTLWKKYLDNVKEKAKEVATAFRGSIGREIESIGEKISDIFSRLGSANKNTAFNYGIEGEKTKADMEWRAAQYEAQMMAKIKGEKDPFQQQRLKAQMERGLGQFQAQIPIDALKNDIAKYKETIKNNRQALSEAENELENQKSAIEKLGADKGVSDYAKLLKEKEAVQDAIRNRGKNAIYGGRTGRTITNAGRLDELNKAIEKAQKDGSDKAYEQFKNAQKGFEANQAKIAGLNDTIKEDVDKWNLAERKLLVAEQKRTNALDKIQTKYKEQIAAIDKAEQAQKIQGQITELEKQRAELLKKQNKATENVSQLEEKLKNALQTQANNAAMNFSDWRKQQEGKTDEADASGRMVVRNRAKALRELNRRQNRGNMMSRFDRKRISQLRDYLGDEAVNSAKSELDEAKQREDERKRMEEERTTSLKNIEDAITTLKEKAGV